MWVRAAWLLSSEGAAQRRARFTVRPVGGTQQAPRVVCKPPKGADLVVEALVGLRFLACGLLDSLLLLASFSHD
jgi:hypothetical protein